MPTKVPPSPSIIQSPTGGCGHPPLHLSKVLLHKVEKIDNEYITTKGINNQVPDEPIKSSAVIGKYMFKIGKAGFLLNLLSTKWAPIVIISALLAVFVLRIAMYFVHKKKVIENISPDDRTRDALTHFFDI